MPYVTLTHQTLTSPPCETNATADATPPYAHHTTIRTTLHTTTPYDAADLRRTDLIPRRGPGRRASDRISDGVMRIQRGLALSSYGTSEGEG